MSIQGLIERENGSSELKGYKVEKELSFGLGLIEQRILQGGSKRRESGMMARFENCRVMRHRWRTRRLERSCENRGRDNRG